MRQTRFRLPKSLRLCSKKEIQLLFKGGKKLDGNLSFLLYRFLKPEPDQEPWQVVFVVPKKRIRLSVNRVYIRRRMREAFRLSQHQIPKLNSEDQLLIAFVYKGDRKCSFDAINQDVIDLLQKLSLRCSGSYSHC